MTKPFLADSKQEGASKMQRTLRSLLHEKYALTVLGVISFTESALPIPLITDPFMVAYIIAHRSRAVAGVVVTTLTSLAGGLGAYLFAAFFTDTLLGFASPELMTEFNNLAASYASSALALGFLGALTPVPFTLAAVVAGALKGNVFLFLIGALIGRAIRYGMTGYLTYRFGETALSIVERNIKPITIIAVIITAIYLLFMM